jgi:hypothetical protein
MRSGFNPTRRNRNIGTAKQGHGRDNRLVIPEICGAERKWGEQLRPHLLVWRIVCGREVAFVVEETLADFVHACTVDDICRVLAHLPAEDWDSLDTFVLRQSTRKQRVLRPAWGRLFYSADLGLPGRKAVRVGPAVMLEAMPHKDTVDWSSSLTPDDAAELERLRADGHEVVREGSRYRISTTPDSVRSTQLYRTLLHEVGHWVDYLEKVERPVTAGGDYAELSAAYFARPKEEREAFAHRYADARRARLVLTHAIPFDPITV